MGRDINLKNVVVRKDTKEADRQILLKDVVSLRENGDNVFRIILSNINNRHINLGGFIPQNNGGRYGLYL